MIEPDTIFRSEAVEFHARGRDKTGGVVRLGAPWLARLFWLTVVLVAGGLVALWTVRVEERASGAALLDPGTGSVTALLPAAAAQDLSQSQGLTLALPGGGQVRVDVTQTRAADDAAIRQAGLRPMSQPGILLTGHVPPDSVPATAEESAVATTASVVIRSERLVDVLGRQFRGMLGQSGVQP